MKNTCLLLTAFASLLTACDQPTTPKANNTPAAKIENTATTSDKPAAKAENTAAASDKPAAQAENAAATGDKPAAKAENAAAASDKPAAKAESAAGDNKTDTASPATPPTFKTAAEALPYLESLLPYDIADSSFRSVRLDNNTYTFTAVIKGVEDAAAFQAGHDMAALQTAYRKGSLPYLCAQEPLATLWAKKKIRNIHLDYQDEHGSPIMQNDIDAAACTDVEAPATPITPKPVSAAAG
ncbi:hypothetical protein [Cardiobacterium valvarum]|uniref:Lipoprotein n=1 Tax=Cardiobacterium valvarum F0432 TaxID=797473 RepID=G9ZD34_9GAMM|nr:hypothetical protein [Cardiobacterium valvarum]EHM55499.1 hypothetical protein HMPREF9080_00667 [Cardiobacterium valvarum F0432]